MKIVNLFGVIAAVGLMLGYLWEAHASTGTERQLYMLTALAWLIIVKLDMGFDKVNGK